jgi:Baseplate J-like protein
MAQITSGGAIPDSPATLRTQLVAAATQLQPSISTDLPASLIEDMASTGAGALVVMDQAYVDAINSISPITANESILIQLGNVYGVQRGVGSNTSVNVVFRDSTVGFVVPKGFLVSDGTHQYSLQSSTVIKSDGTSDPVFCLATTEGSWTVAGASSGFPFGTVTTIITSVPSTVTLNVGNPQAGTAGYPAQSIDEFRLQVIQAGRAVATGVPTFLKTTLQNVSGVQKRLIAVKQITVMSVTGWEVIVGGGDPYSVANAIYQSLFNINDLMDAQTYGTTETIAILDYPDSYNIKFVVPRNLTANVEVYWTTISGTNFVSNTVVAAAVSPAIQAYINSLYVGQPISLAELQATFFTATANILSPATLATLGFLVFAPTELTPVGLLYPVDPESYYSAGTVTVSNTTPP